MIRMRINKNSLANIQIYLKNLKEVANAMLHHAIKKLSSKLVLNDSDDSDFEFKKNIKTENKKDEETKKKEDEELKQQEELNKKMRVFLIMWLRQIVIYNTHYVLHLAVTNSNIASILDVKPSIVKATSIKYALVSLMNPRMQSQQQVNNFKSMKRILDNNLTYFFENFLSSKERAYVCEDLAKLRENGNKMNEMKYLKFSQFFESNDEFKKFYSFMDLNYYISNVLELEISLMKHTNKDYCKETIDRIQEKYNSGIEVFKKSGEHISQFCFDFCDNDILAFTMKEEGIREVKLLQSLSLRNRKEPGGHEVFDQELDNWSECLHRYDNYPKDDSNKTPYEVINGAVGSLYKEKTINYTRNKRSNRGMTSQAHGSKVKLMLTDIEPKPPQVWNGNESNEFLKMGQMKKSTSHADFSTCIAAHPKLPLYVTGNNKGKLCVWPFNNLADTTVGNEYYTYHQKNNTSSKKLTLEKCMFSNYGDKLATLNSDGTIFMFNFNMDPSNIYPFFKQKSEKEMKMKDFDFLNRDTVVAGVSKRAYGLAIYDLLLPNHKNIIYTSKDIGGTKLCTLLRHQQIITFNSNKNGAIKIFDIRQQRIMDTIQLVNEEITAVTLNRSQDTLVTGTKDGVIKIWDLDNNFALRESIDAFIDPGTHKQKHEVSCVLQHPLNDSLFASSYDGSIKLIRIHI